MNNQTKYIIGGSIAFVVLIILLFSLGIVQNAVSPSGNLKLAVPHYGSFECKEYPAKVGQGGAIPSSGLFLSKQTIGVYAPDIHNIATSVDYGFWTSLIKDLRVRYSVCDSNGANCGSEKVVKYITAGTRQMIIPSINLQQQSLRVNFEQLTLLNYLVGKWTPFDGATISYDVTPYKLVYHSTLNDVAGAIVCATSCDLNCHDIGVKQPLTFANVDMLDFGATAPSFEYWDDIPYDLNAQGGVPVYDSITNKFCFSGTIYSASKMTTQYGTTYIFPDVNSKESHLCCPKATISATYSDKVCQPDGNSWKVIDHTDILPCISDAMCPKAGNTICQNRQLSSGYSCVNKDVNGVGICQRASAGTTVACCLDSDCNKDMTCDLSSHTCKGGSTNPVCGNGIIESGEQCDDGNTVSGDGCSATCQQELCGSGLNKCSDGSCQSVCPIQCTALLGGLVPSNAGTVSDCNFGCQLTKTVTFGLVDNTKSTSTCLYDWTAIIIFGIILIIGLIIFAVMKGGKGKGKKVSSKTIKWLIIVIVAGLAIFFLWKYIIWILIILIVLALLDTFLFGGIIKKVIFRG